MERTYWLKQTKEKPLFPDLMWSRPEMKSQAGKLLVLGGNVHGFAAAAESYSEATKAGAGSVRVLLPDSLQRTVGRVFEAGEYVPSTPSGSFSRQALSDVLAASLWSDAVMLAGDFGHNSETAVLLESFLDKSQGMCAITQDALDYFTKTPLKLLERQGTLITASFAQLQRMASAARFPKAFTFDMGLIRLVEQLHEFSLAHPASIIVRHLDNTLAAVSGMVSTTQKTDDEDIWRVRTCSNAIVWWMQNPSRPLEALSCALVDR